jgi:hypothetical protein
MPVGLDRRSGGAVAFPLRDVTLYYNRRAMGTIRKGANLSGPGLTHSAPVVKQSAVRGQWGAATNMGIGRVRLTMMKLAKTIGL